MPAIVASANYAAWLDGSAGVDLLALYPAEKMDAYAVSKAVGNAKIDGPVPIERVA
jgi:putative SOS response-associated peptidase YedK